MLIKNVGIFTVTVRVHLHNHDPGVEDDVLVISWFVRMYDAIMHERERAEQVTFKGQLFDRPVCSDFLETSICQKDMKVPTLIELQMWTG